MKNVDLSSMNVECGFQNNLFFIWRREMRLIIILIVCLINVVYLDAMPLKFDFAVPADGVFPCLIIAPGAGYHKDLPLIKNLYNESLKNGFAVLRFDWDYFTKGEKASENYEEELKQLTALIEFVKADQRVNKEKIFVAGKSLGSVLAYRSVYQRDDIDGLLLLTPIFPNNDSAYRLHNDIENLNIPTFIIVGDNDNANCNLKTLYEVNAKIKGDTFITVVPGDHSFNIEPFQADVISEVNNKNIALVIENIINWLKNRNKG